MNGAGIQPRNQLPSLRGSMRRLGSPGDGIFDPFLGSGPSLLAAEQCERTVYGCEMSLRLLAIILERWHQLTGNQPQRLSS